MPKQCFGKSHVPLSPAVRAGDFVYVSGQVPVDATGIVIQGGIEAQTRQVLENVKESVKQAADRFAGTEGVISRLVSQMSDAAKAKYEAQRFALNHVRA